MKTFIYVLLGAISLSALADESSPALLCADQADNRILLFDPFGKGDRKPTLWSYPTEDSAPSKYKPTDAKRVEIDGVTHILAAFHGRVQLVRFKDKELIKDFPSYSSCHSAELLPDGAIVTACSNHGKLRLHRSASDFVDIDLPYAHGVTWDKKRGCLWALGDRLYRINYTKGKLIIDQTFELPLSPTGHDLFPLQQEEKLLVSNNDALFLFDIATEKFETVSELKHIKSASQDSEGAIWVSDPRDLKDASDWQSDAVIQVRPASTDDRHSNEGAKFYKARWWQNVKFSY